MTRHSVNSTSGRTPPAPPAPATQAPPLDQVAPTKRPYPYMAPSASVSEELNAAYTLQNLHNAASKSIPVPTTNETVDVDYLTCGNCQKEFLLSNIVDFMRHKKLDCRDTPYTGSATDLYQRLRCQIRDCQQKFATAWGLLQHVQKSHALNIFLNSDVYGRGIETVQVQQETASAGQKSSNPLDMFLILGGEGYQQEAKNARLTVSTQTENPTGEECEDPCQDFCSPEVCAVRQCCDTQNCCITIMPGTHERPRKCCASVVPKKRKQHMEQHINTDGPATRTRRRKSGETRPDTIFIDFGTPMENGQDARPQQNQVYQQTGMTGHHAASSDGYIQVDGTNMYVRNADNSMTFSVDQAGQASYSAQDFSLPESFQTLLDDLPLDLPDTEKKEGKKKRYPTSKPFKCEHCGMAFNQRIHLKKHLSKHTGIKPFKCGQCNYSTVERSHLKVHIRIHTGEKPFKCGFCEYATAQNSTLKIHLKRHHSGMTLSCTVCGKNFEQPKQLNQHKQEHQGQHSEAETQMSTDDTSLIGESS